MSAAGLSKSGLERMHRVLSGHVERKDIPGLVALVSRHDEGRFGWNGGFGTTAYTDPANEMIGILFT